MADETKRGFPKMPETAWRKLREEFKKSMPTRVNETYLHSKLNISELSAKTNIMPALRAVGLIKEDGTLNTERARRWRDDESYPSVCEEMRNEVYPQEFLDAFATADPKRVELVRWIQSKSNVGEGAAKMMASFYQLLAEANPSREPKRELKKVEQASKDRGTSTVRRENRFSKPRGEQARKPNVPSIHLDIQIHISPDANSDQIDQIFAGLAKHLRDFSRDE
jgi:hypothetical protein